MYKYIVVFLLISLLGSERLMAAAGDSSSIWISTTLSFQVYDEVGVSVLSYGSYADGFSGLVQLIYAGVDGANAADNVGDGAAGDDVVVAYTFIGAGYAPASRPGRFQYQGLVTLTDPTYVNGDDFFIRVWQDPASSIGSGLAPTTVGSYYGDTGLYNLSNMGTPPGEDQFFLTSNLTTGLQSVPEPSTMALMALGMASVGFYRRRKKSL